MRCGFAYYGRSHSCTTNHQLLVILFTELHSIILIETWSYLFKSFRSELPVHRIHKRDFAFSFCLYVRFFSVDRRRSVNEILKPTICLHRKFIINDDVTWALPHLAFVEGWRFNALRLSMQQNFELFLLIGC